MPKRAGQPSEISPPTRNAAEDYRKKVLHEASRIARNLQKAGHPKPLGDPSSGILFVVEQPVGPRVIEAIEKSLEAVRLSEAYVTWSSTGLLPEEILVVQPTILTCVGSEAAHDIDNLAYPLSRRTFSEAPQGAWFPWTRSTSGLLLPALAPALNSEEAKKRFWRHFLPLKNLSANATETHFSQRPAPK